MANEGKRSQYFVAGGTLRPSVPSYVHRPADDELFSLAKDGEFCYVLTPRQMGKSSLMIRAAQRLQNEGVQTIIIDLTEIGIVPVDEWYLGLITEIKRSLRVQMDVNQWWTDHQHLGQPQRFRDFLQDIVLAEVESQIVIFIDEIDSTLKLDFRDDFFAVIRAFYNSRSRNPELARLSFVLLGVASPADLIEDRTRTPFNIGHEINLKEISYEDAVVLIEGLDNVFPNRGGVIFDRIYYWTSGHPYLTQKLCASITQQPDSDWEDLEIDELVNRTFITDEARGETNIQFVNDLITTHSKKVEMLKTYRRVYEHKKVAEEKTSTAQSQLKLSGLVKIENGELVVRNRIYHDAFGMTWVKEHTAVNWQLLITIASLTIAFALVGIFGFNAYQNQKANDAELVFLQGESPEAQSEALETLFSLWALPFIGVDHDIRAYDLFFELDSWEDQSKIYISAEEEHLILIAQKMYITMALVDERNDDSSHVLNKILKELNKFNSNPEAQILINEIDVWLLARREMSNGNLNKAHDYYNEAININDQNPATRFERARVLLLIAEYQDAAVDLNSVLTSAERSVVPIETPTAEGTLASGTTITSTETPVTGTTITPTIEETPASGTVVTPTEAPASGTTVTPTETPAGGTVVTPTETPASGTTVTPTESPMPTVSPTPLPPLRSEFVTRVQIISAVRKLINEFPDFFNYLVESDQSEYILLVESGIIPTQSPTATSTRTPSITPSQDSNVAIADVETRTPVPTSEGNNSTTTPVISASNTPQNNQTFTVEAEVEERAIRSRELANTAQLQINSSPSFGLLLALEAFNILSAEDEVPSITESVLHNALQSLQLRRVLSRHTDEVTDVAVSPDGSRFATVSLDQTVKIWDTATGQEIQTFERGHNRPINTVAYHTTENVLATGGDDGFVILWNLDTGSSFAVLPHGTNNPVREVSFSPDGSQVAAVTTDNLLYLWETATRIPIEVLEGHEAVLTDVAYSPDGRFLATTSDDGSVILRDAASNTIIQSIDPTFANENEEIEFSATAVTFSPDNQLLAAAFGNGVILIWQTGSWEELATLSGHANRINEVVFSPNSQLLGSASNDNTAKVYDVATAQALFTLSGHTGGISSIAFTPDGDTIITTSKDGTIRLWNDEAGLAPDILTGHSDTIRALDFNANGTRIASGGVGQIVYIWDTGSNEIIDRLIEHTSTINDVAFHPTNENLLATVGNDTKAYLWDLNTGEVLEPPMDHDANVTAVFFNPDGSMLITGSADGLITLWDTETHQRLLTLDNESPVRDVAISPDGTLLAAGLDNNTAAIWDIQNGSNQIIHIFAEHEGPVNTVTFSPDNQYLATGSEDNTAKIWNVNSGEIVRTLTGHSGPITDVAFHPDSTTNRIATASIDGTMKLWDIESALIVRNFTGHTGAVNRVVFSPDAQTLATVSADRTIRLNHLESVADLFARGLTLATRSLTPEECAQYVGEGECLTIEN